MRKKLAPSWERCRIAGDESFGPVGLFRIPYGRDALTVACGDGEGWDHVSVSLRSRCPTWGEMEFVRAIWFEDDETVVQFSPPRDRMVNNHPYCLHMWRSQNETQPVPDERLVGIRGLNPVDPAAM